jgi:hypothetical protein
MLRRLIAVTLMPASAGAGCTASIRSDGAGMTGMTPAIFTMNKQILGVFFY